MEALRPRLDAVGALAPAVLDALARTADRNRPTLMRGAPHDGEPPQVAYDASYHRLQAEARRHRVFTLHWHPLAGVGHPTRATWEHQRSRADPTRE